MYFLLYVRDGVPGVLKRLSEDWNTSVEQAREILLNKTLFEGCPAVLHADDDDFDNGYFDTNDPQSTYYFLMEE